MTVTAAQRRAGVAVDRANREKDDFYPTPPRGTQALLAVETFNGPIWEPACGDGAISRELEAAGYEVISTDLVNRGFGQSGVDFLMETKPLAPNIVTNPPFKLAVPFVRRALDLAAGKVAVLCKLSFLEGGEKCGRKQLFAEFPPSRVWVFQNRLSMYRSGITLDNGGTLAFAWYVWDRSHVGPTCLGWLP